VVLLVWKCFYEYGLVFFFSSMQLRKRKTWEHGLETQANGIDAIFRRMRVAYYKMHLIFFLNSQQNYQIENRMPLHNSSTCLNNLYVWWDGQCRTQSSIKKCIFFTCIQI